VGDEERERGTPRPPGNDAQHSARTGAAQPAAHTGRALRILVADDERNVRRSLSLLLRSAGHAVVECEGGREAVERYGRDWREIDVVILDLTMPDLSGGEVFTAIRAANPRAPVVVSSGFGLGGGAESLAREPGVLALPKPYTSEELKRVLAEVVGSRAD
jgi:CheY-like chemotaxis protein